MDTYADTKRRALQARIEIKRGQWEAINKQIDTTLDKGQEYVLRLQADAIDAEICGLEEELGSLELRDFVWGIENSGAFAAENTIPGRNNEQSRVPVLSLTERSDIARILNRIRLWETTNGSSRRRLLVDAGLPQEWIASLSIDGTARDSFNVVDRIQELRSVGADRPRSGLELLLVWMFDRILDVSTRNQLEQMLCRLR